MLAAVSIASLCAAALAVVAAPAAPADVLRARDTPATQLARRRVVNMTAGISTYGYQYFGNVTLANQTFSAILDTGSSDTLFVAAGFVCTDPATGDPLASEDACGLTNLLQVPASMELDAETFFLAQYDGNASLSGQYTRADLDLGGVQVSMQTVAIVEQASAVDSLASALIGLARNRITSIYFAANNTPADPYPTFVESLVAQGVIDPVFTFALERGDADGNGAGWFVLGGEIPDGSGIRTVGDYVTAPLVIRNMTGAVPDSFLPRLNGTDAWYTIDVDGAGVSGNFTMGSFQAQVDTGIPYIGLPQPIADAVNAQFQPPAVFSPSLNAYAVDCDARAPYNLAVIVGGSRFYIDPAALITEIPGGACITTVLGSDAGPLVLGDAFLQSVVAVFDFGKEEMRFAPR
ncbi:hypothetical protein HK405_014912, partial [Cladochytrium tenue]